MCGRTVDVRTHSASSAISGDSSVGVLKSRGTPQSAGLETSGGHPGSPQLGRIFICCHACVCRSRIRWPRPFVTPGPGEATTGKTWQELSGPSGVRRSNRDGNRTRLGGTCVPSAVVYLYTTACWREMRMMALLPVGRHSTDKHVTTIKAHASVASRSGSISSVEFTDHHKDYQGKQAGADVIR
jgi:hypothetical protein